MLIRWEYFGDGAAQVDLQMQQQQILKHQLIELELKNKEYQRESIKQHRHDQEQQHL